MKYTQINNTTHLIEVPTSDFKILLNDSKKKSALPKNYCNAGFFANYQEKNQPFTLPVAHLLCDYDATSQYTKHYCAQRGKFNGNKFTFDSSTWAYDNPCYNKAISTLLVKNNKAEIKEIVSIPTGYNYAISGIPIVKNGLSVNFETDVIPQGWDGSPLYGTWHIFIGLKKDSNFIYVIGMQTTTWNMVKTNEAYQKFKTLGMYDVIKLDGGGSFHMNVSGKAIASTYEDRRVNTIICFGDEIKDMVNNDNNSDKSNTKDIVDNKINDDKTINEMTDKASQNIVNNKNSKPRKISQIFSKKINKHEKIIKTCKFN